jgi:hypothetical protein
MAVFLKCVVVCSQGPEHHPGAGHQQDLCASARHTDRRHPQHLCARTAQTEGGSAGTKIRHQRHLRGVWTPAGEVVLSY